MSKYNKYSSKTEQTNKTWHYFVATNKTITERFRATKELHELMEDKAKRLGITKSQYLTSLILVDNGYEKAKPKELVYGVDWEL